MIYASPRFSSARAVLRALGGSLVVAERHGWPVNTVESWGKTKRNSIPVEHWPALIASGPGQLINLTADDLMRACAPAKGKLGIAIGQDVDAQPGAASEAASFETRPAGAPQDEGCAGGQTS